MSTLSPVPEDAGSPTSSKKRSTRVACCHCRKRKHACDGARPTCTPCIRRNLECIYDTQDNSETRLSALRRQLGLLKEQKQSSKEQLDDISETFHLLKAIPEDKALQLLKRVRASRDPVAAMSALRRSMLQSRTFGGEAARSPGFPTQIQSDGLISPVLDNDTTPEDDVGTAHFVRMRASTSVLRHEQTSVSLVDGPPTDVDTWNRPPDPLAFYPTQYVHPPLGSEVPNAPHMSGHARPAYAVRRGSSSTGFEYF